MSSRNVIPRKNSNHVQIFQRRWYVLARNPENDTLHTYSLDRITSVIIAFNEWIKLVVVKLTPTETPASASHPDTLNW